MTRHTAESHLSEKEVRKRLRGFDKAFAPYRTKLVDRYGESLADTVMAQTRVEYEEILPQTPVFPGTLNIFNMVMAINAKIVAFHRAMRQGGRTVEETGSILFEVAEDEHEAIPTAVRWLARKLMFSRLFLMLTRSCAKNVHDHPQGWKIDYQRGDGAVSDWYFDCTECGVIKYFERHGVEDLKQYCNYVDYIQSRVFGLGLQNPKSIGQGDRVCIEHFKQGRPTVLPDNLRVIASTMEGEA